MLYFYLYVIGFFLVNAAFAFRIPFEDTQTVFWFSLFWPLTCTAMLLIQLVLWFGWNFDVLVKPKWFGFRKPIDGWPGFAVIICRIEFMFWKNRS